MHDFNLFEAMTGSISRLPHINRYSSYPVLRPENVAEHSWQVAFVGMVIAYDMLDNYGEHLEPGVVAMKGLVHDVSECMSGDIIRSYKYGSEEMRDACKRADQNNIELLGDEFGMVGDVIVNGWQHAKSGDLESRIVRFADLVSVVLYCRREHLLGNRTLDQMMRHAVNTLILPYTDDHYFGRYVEQLFPTGKYTDAYRIAGVYEKEQLIPAWSHNEGTTAEYTIDHPTGQVPLS